MKKCMAEAYKELVENCEILEAHYKDMMVKTIHTTSVLVSTSALRIFIAFLSCVKIVYSC